MVDISKRENIAVVMDQRIPREKLQLLTRVVNELRRFTLVQVFDGDISEEDLLARIAEKPFKLILAPWYRYLTWNKIEAQLGQTRTSGVIFAGYFADQVLPYELGDIGDKTRTILLDFSYIKPGEIVQILKSLINENRRTGLRPFLGAEAPVYCENWFASQGLGSRIDAVLSIPEISDASWRNRAPAIRICLSALWSLIYEEGPGKSEFAKTQSITAKNPIAYFQVGASAQFLALRLCYAMPGVSPKSALTGFWPDQKKPTSAAQLLLKYCDLLRMHTIAESSEIELLILMTASSPSEMAHQNIHTLWVDPISPQLITELPFQMPGNPQDNLKPLEVNLQNQSTVSSANLNEVKAEIKAKERFLFHAAVKIRELKKTLSEKDDAIHELRAGGIGTATPLPPPDAESLLDALQERFFESQYQIRQLEIQLEKASDPDAEPNKLEELQQKIAAIANREQVWIKKIADTIEIYKAKKKERASG